MHNSRHWTGLLQSAPILLVFLSIPFVVIGTVRVESDSSGFIQWMPDDQTAKREYEQFVARFGSDDFVLVTWPGCTLDDSKLADLAAALERNARTAPAGDSRPARLIRRAQTGPQLLREMTAEPLNLSEREAIRRLRGTLIEPDTELTALIVQLTQEGRHNQRAAVRLIEQSAEQHAGIDAADLHMGGTVIEATSMELEMERTLHRFVLPILLVTLAITWWFLRSVRQVAIVLSVAFYCRCLSLALVYFSGHKLSVVLSIMPVLVYVLAVSGGVHLVNYYRDALAGGSVRRAPRESFQAGWLPCTLAVVTTMIGLLSLSLSSIVPVKMFGLYSALSMALSLIVLLTVIPWALRFGLRAGEVRSVRRKSTTGGRTYGRALIDRLASLVTRHHFWIVLAGAAFVMASARGLQHVTTTVDVEHMFSRRSRLIRDYQWIETHLGPLSSIETVIEFDERCRLDPLQRVTLVSEIEAAIRDLPDVGGTMSTGTFLPEVPKRGGLRQTARRSVFRRKLKQVQPELAARGYLAVDGDRQYWRLTARVPALDPRDYGELIRSVKRPALAIIDTLQEADAEGITVTCTGLVPMMQQAQQQVLDDLMKSLLTAAILICPVMIGILRSFWSGMLSMIPNLFPMVVVFGILGWTSKPIDVGIMLTASVALGIAVDDTLHFLTWFSRGLRAGLPRLRAVRYAYHKCTGAMIQTTCICGLGLMPCVFIQFIPTREFALLLCAILLVALIGDLVLLPAILVGPLGRLFVPRNLRRKA